MRTLIHHNQPKETTNKLYIVDRDTFRKIRPGKRKSQLQIGKPKLKITLQNTIMAQIKVIQQNVIK